MGAIKIPEPSADIIWQRSEIVSGLKKILPPDAVISDKIALAPYETDALTAYKRTPMVVTLPRTTDDVSKILAFCHQRKVPVFPRGAGTSLSGGALPREDGVVIGLARMNKVLATNFENRTITVEAGVTNLAISEHVSEAGYFYAPDPSSQLACSIAGNIAMNSGGAHCLKYGVTTNNLLGVKLVLRDGSVTEIGGDYLDSSGYDLLGLICGSEGQLGIVTEATLRILPMAEGAQPVLFGFEEIEDAGACVAGIISAGVVPVAMEFMDKLAIQICEDFAQAGYPREAEAMLIVEVEGSAMERKNQLDKIVAIAKIHNVQTIKESQSAMEAAAIWKGRKSAFGATGRVADYICMDGTIPTSKLPEMLQKMMRIVSGYGLRVANVFHAGDGNLHPLILYDVNDEGERNKAELAGNDILKLCVEMGGCLTGEHGVGIEKRDLMPLQFTPDDLRQQKSVRSIFDPDNLMNPGKVFPLEGPEPSNSAGQ